MKRLLNSVVWVTCAPVCAFSAQGAGKQTVNGHIPNAAASIAPQGRLAGTTQMNLAIGLPLRNITRLRRGLWMISQIEIRTYES
jgi:hypothetical protein